MKRHRNGFAVLITFYGTLVEGLITFESTLAIKMKTTRFAMTTIV